tara:strand:- start:47 stop:2683 length:2637 start_codon:yes stop_codon:yes gene_type:complete
MSGPFGSTPHNLFNTTSTSFYNGVVNQSVKFSDNHHLDRTATAGNVSTWTFSAWIKRAELGTTQYIWTPYYGGDGTNESAFRFTTADQINVYDSGATRGQVTTTAVYRDVASWMHLVVALDLTESTAADRIKIYVNSVLQDKTVNNTITTGGWGWNVDSNVHRLGGYARNTTSNLVGYMAEINFVDGTALTPTTFGESKNGIWIPKEVTGVNYGTNGFRVTFADSSDLGNNANSTDGTNDFTTVTNLAASDVMPDSPENNFPVMNSICDKGSAQSVFAFTEGNLKVRNTASNYSQAITTRSVRTGKWYYECYINEAGYPSWMIGWMVGRQNGLGENEFPTFAGAANAEQASFTGFGYFTGSNLYISDWGDTSGGIATQQFAYSGAHSAGDAPTTGDIIGVAADFDNRKFYWHINGEYIDSGSGTSNPSTGANANSTYTASEAPDDAEKYPWLTGYGTSSFIFNFGQDGTFAGNKTAQGNADANGVGNFYYSVPTGFLAFTSKNFSDTTLSPNGTEQATDNFSTILYTGNASSRSLTGVGFQPDWVWIKDRNDGDNHVVHDSVRGVQKRLYINDTSSEADRSSAGGGSDDGLSSFDSDGFSIGDWNNINQSTINYVAWSWKAGGAPTATNSAGAGNVPTAGSVMIDGVASTSALAGTIAATNISANTKAGFSIVTYTGTGSNATVAHGLTSAPDVCIVKERGGTGNWFVYSRAENDQASDEAHVGYFNLSTSAFTTSAVIFNDTPPTDTVFHLGTGNSNTSTDTYVAYLFHEVEGFSKFGYFAGNSSADGTFVYCGFKPARIWLRQDATGIDWTSYDLLREGFNVENDSLRFAAATEQADDDIDILSNGFKCRRNFANNQGDVLFFAWADSPVKYSNAR